MVVLVGVVGLCLNSLLTASPLCSSGHTALSQSSTSHACSISQLGVITKLSDSDQVAIDFTVWAESQSAWIR